ncbi:hypothetical protein QCN27_04000 [Cereibacter sp. SYSU M97828]|nr:hypothetical protein [Cereibacter flavus]
MNRTLILVAALVVLGFVIFGIGSMGEQETDIPQDSGNPHAIDQGNGGP